MGNITEENDDDDVASISKHLAIVWVCCLWDGKISLDMFCFVAFNCLR